MTPEQIQKIKYIILNHWKGEKEIYNSKERDRQTKKTDLETTISRLKHKIQASVIPNMSIDESKHIDVTNKEALLVFLKVIQEGGTEGTALEKLEAHLSKKQFSYANQATQAAAQSNETQTTGKRTIEGIKSDSKKIQWIGTREELRSLFDLLYESGLLADGSYIPTLAQNHFYISGNKPIDRTNFAKVKRLKKDVSRETVEQFLECLREQEELK